MGAKRGPLYALRGGRFEPAFPGEEVVDAGTRRAAFYSSLTAGPHVFQVEATNDDVRRSPQEARFAFTLAALVSCN